MGSLKVVLVELIVKAVDHLQQLDQEYYKSRESVAFFRTTLLLQAKANLFSFKTGCLRLACVSLHQSSNRKALELDKSRV
jgi:hypothetical protein